MVFFIAHLEIILETNCLSATLFEPTGKQPRRVSSSRPSRPSGVEKRPVRAPSKASLLARKRERVAIRALQHGPFIASLLAHHLLDPNNSCLGGSRGAHKDRARVLVRGMERLRVVSSLAAVQ